MSDEQLGVASSQFDFTRNITSLEIRSSSSLISDEASLFQYVSSLSRETHEWLLALFVDADMKLLGVHAVARGAVNDCPIDSEKIYSRGRSLQAAGFLLAHNHPSGETTPSAAKRLSTANLAYVMRELDLPLIDYFVIGDGNIISIR